MLFAHYSYSSSLLTQNLHQETLITRKDHVHNLVQLCNVAVPKTNLARLLLLRGTIICREMHSTLDNYA